MLLAPPSRKDPAPAVKTSARFRRGKYKVIGIFDDLALAKEARKKAEKENGYHENHGKA